jgi:hypothetical protein
VFGSSSLFEIMACKVVNNANVRELSNWSWTWANFLSCRLDVVLFIFFPWNLDGMTSSSVIKNNCYCCFLLCQVKHPSSFYDCRSTATQNMALVRVGYPAVFKEWKGFLGGLQSHCLRATICFHVKLYWSPSPSSPCWHWDIRPSRTGRTGCLEALSMAYVLFFLRDTSWSLPAHVSSSYLVKTETHRQKPRTQGL